MKTVRRWPTATTWLIVTFVVSAADLVVEVLRW